MIPLPATETNRLLEEEGTTSVIRVVRGEPRREGIHVLPVSWSAKLVQPLDNQETETAGERGLFIKVGYVTLPAPRAGLKLGKVERVHEDGDTSLGEMGGRGEKIDSFATPLVPLGPTVGFTHFYSLLLYVLYHTRDRGEEPSRVGGD